MNKRIKCGYYLLPLAFCLFLFSCGGSGTENSESGSTSSGTGTIVFDLEWQHFSRAAVSSDESRSTPQATIRASSDCCVDYGISTVSAKIFNSSNAQIASENWSCSAHQGTITGVPVGSNHWIRIEGTVSGVGVCWKAEKTGISVSAGSTTQVGSVTMTYICNDATPPTVTPTNPTSGSINVPVTTSVSATFSEPMAISSLNTTTFTLVKGSTSVSGIVTYDSSAKKATFVPSSNLDYSTSYTVTITTGVTDMSGINMSANAQWSFTTEASPTAIPFPPTGLSATAGNGQVSIAWNSVTGATAYNIYWSTTTGVTKATGAKIRNVSSPYVHTGLTNGTTYYYVVTAENSYGESAESSQLSEAPGSVSSPPTGVIASPGNGQVTISWSSVTGATSYNLYWSLTPGVNKTNGTKIPSVTSPYVHSGLTNGTTYYYVVTAVNSYGESGESAQQSAIPGTAPPPPTGVTATPGNGQVTISWSSAAGATSYNLYWSLSAGVNKTNGTKIPSVANPYVHSGLTNGTTYYYVVTAVNSYGESAESSPVGPVIPGTAPPPPTGVTATPGNGQVTISWSSVTGATSYNIYWSLAAGVNKTNGTKIPNVTSPHVHLGLTSGMTYYYVVTALNSYGESGESTQQSALLTSGSPTHVNHQAPNTPIDILLSTLQTTRDFTILGTSNYQNVTETTGGLTFVTGQSLSAGNLFLVAFDGAAFNGQQIYICSKTSGGTSTIGSGTPPQGSSKFNFMAVTSLNYGSLIYVTNQGCSSGTNMPVYITAISQVEVTVSISFSSPGGIVIDPGGTAILARIR